MKSKQERGITLIALVIMIIILLILAGVTLKAALGENGLIQRTKQAVDAYQTESQREYLQQLILGMQLDNYSGNSTDDEELKKLGVKLYKKSLENTSKWHIVDVGEDRYDDRIGDWYFIKKGTDLEGYGKASSSMLINYETGEIRELEEGEYVELSAGDMVYVKEDMIINIDSSIADEEVENKKEDLEAYFGNGVTLQNFNYNEESGVSLDGFKFDGIDDYMTVEYQDEAKVDAMLQNGFTFEFYGLASNSSRYKYESGENTKLSSDNSGGGFGWWCSDPAKSERFHFQFRNDSNKLTLNWSNNPNINNRPFIPSEPYTAGLRLGPEGSSPNYGWNSFANATVTSSDGCYFSITLDPNNKQTKNGFDAIQQTLYINGKKDSSSWYYLDQWTNLNTNKTDLKYFTIGSTTQNGFGYWWVGKMNFKSLRLYNRALTDAEVR